MNSPARSHQRSVRMLEEDPGLGVGLSPQLFFEARSVLLAPVIAPAGATWTDEALDSAASGALGLVLLDGILCREIAMSDSVMAEVLGPGDVIRSCGAQDPSRLLEAQVRWTMLDPTRLAVLGPDFTRVVGEYPSVLMVLLQRLVERTHRLATSQAISQLTGVERRIEALMWQLAERWGRVGSDGVVLPLVLPHRIIAQLIGARRPTVSTALQALARQDRLRRREDGAWLLLGEPFGMPTGTACRMIPTRRPKRAVPGPPGPKPL